MIKQYARLGLLISVVHVSLAIASSANSERLRYFCESYPECRSRFIETAGNVAKSDPLVRAGKWAVASRRPGADLSIDYLFLPAKGTPRNLLIVTSGVHGVEGFVGSAVQQYFLKEILPKVDREATGVLVVHSINPFGMQFQRRVNEDNVDLNRNFDTDRKLFSMKNPGYAKLSPMLNPKGRVSSNFFSIAWFYGKVARLLLSEPMKTLRQATLSGQYEYPEGLYYGGQDFVPQKAPLEKMFLATAAPYKSVLVLDLHTGYGKKGALHLFPSEFKHAGAQELKKAVFQGFHVEDPNGEDFYDNYGDFSTYVAKLLIAEGKTAFPMVLEYGTLDSQTKRGALESIRRMVFENQLHWNEVRKIQVSASTTKKIRKEVVEMYFPSESSWRQRIMDVTALQLPVFVSRFQKLP